jgi:hypothetical protein
VTGTLQRRFKVWLAAAATAMAAWFWLPGSALDRTAFSAVARGFANPPFFISGNGSHASPWKLRTFVSQAKPDSRQSPVIVSLGDDPEGVFQTLPPSPIDLAVILTNFQRLGANKAATAAVLAWDAPDPIGLTALDKAISRFDSLVMAAPLSRGAVPELMPPAFRRASVPLANIHGDTSSLPVVNRIPIPGIILGKENALAGFQVLESEPATDFPPLLARWEDRIVFSFPLLSVLQGMELPLDGIEIHPGEFVKLSANGPFLPIDPYGRLTIPLKPLAPGAEIPAEALIDGGDELFPKQAPGSVVLRDLRSAAEPATRAFSESLPALIAAITSAGLAPEHEFRRLSKGWEISSLLLVCLALAACARLPDFPRNIAFLTLAAFGITAQYIAAGSAMIWLPGLAALAALGCAFCAARLIPEAAPKPPVVRIQANPAPTPESKPAGEPPAPEPQVKKTAKAPPVKPRQNGKKNRR